MLSVEGVSRRFANGTEALRGVSLRLGAGEFVVLLGASGCGKSTLLRIISGLDMPDQGSVRWDDGKPAPGRIGFVFQDPTLLPWASAAENVALPLRLQRADPAQARLRAAAALERVGLRGFEHAKPRELSGGMRMRVSIARGLVQQPAVLLMDEPFAALDEFTRHGLQDQLLAACEQAGCSVVFVTHSITEAAYLASRVVVMSPRPGRIAAELASPPPRGARLGPGHLALIARLETAMDAARTG